jgi:hypothetical protein
VERALHAAGGVGVTWIGVAVAAGPQAALGAALFADGEECALEGFEHRW